MNKKLQILYIFFIIISFKGIIHSEEFIKKGSDIKINADKIIFNKNTQTIKAFTNVKVSSSGMILTGDRLFMDPKNQILSVTGHASLKKDTDSFNGTSIFLNYKTKKGVIKNGKIFIGEINLYIGGETIEKTSEKTFFIEKASVTSCEDPKNNWEIKAGRLKATIDGYGYAYNATFHTMERPVLYTPFLFFPVKSKRESGLLIPQIEFSDKYGMEYSQPLYITLTDRADATIYYKYIEKRSDRKGIEFRLKASKDSFLQLFYNEIRKDPYLYKADETDFLPQKTRYWFAMKSDNSIAGFKINMDIDLVSDPDYLEDFDDGYLGYDFIEKRLNKNFGRDLEPEDDYSRTNKVYISKNYSPGLFETEFLWIDDLVIKETDSKNKTVQRLPKISFTGNRKNIGSSSFQTSFESDFNYFHRINGKKGSRLNFTPVIYYPFSFSNYLDIEPSFYVNETLWYTKKNEDKNHFRQLYSFDIKTSSSFYKIFNIYGKNIEKIKHIISPEINFYFVQEKDQNKLPYFDDFDRIEQKKEIEFKLLQTLTSKEKWPSSETDTQEKYNYREILKFELSQLYDFIENKKEDESDGQYEAKPFKDLKAKIKFSPSDRFNMEFNSEWSHYDHLMTESNIRLQTLTKKGSSFDIEYRCTRDEDESLNIDTNFVISNSIKVSAMFKKNIMEESIRTGDTEKEIGIEYSAQCWTANILYNQKDYYNKRNDEKKVTLQITLKSLGGIYQSLSD